MSMRENLSSGYVIEASKLLAILPAEKCAEYNTLLEEHDFENAIELLEKHGGGYIVPTEMFVLGDEDSSADLEKFVVYAYYEEDDLYISAPTGDYTLLADKLKAECEHASWSIYG